MCFMCFIYRALIVFYGVLWVFVSSVSSKPMCVCDCVCVCVLLQRWVGEEYEASQEEMLCEGCGAEASFSCVTRLREISCKRTKIGAKLR